MTTHARTSAAASEQLIDEIHAIAEHAEKLLGATLSQCMGEDGASLRNRLAGAQTKLAGLCARARDEVKDGARKVEAEARTHPYEAVALALGIGALLEALLHARRAGNGSTEESR